MRPERNHVASPRSLPVIAFSKRDHCHADGPLNSAKGYNNGMMGAKYLDDVVSFRNLSVIHQNGNIITVVLILGGIFVTLILVSVLATLLWKVHKYQYKKKLERTWEERVRQAGLELEKQEQEAKMKKLEDSKELEQKEKSIDESKEPMGSLEITNSKERLSNEPANGPSADPFGDFIAKVDAGNAPPQPPPGTQ
nr:unnamed protein product [Haemonchus contortus]